jgi:serine/threonine-protein kinase
MWQKLLRALGCIAYLGLLAGIFALVSYLAFSLFVRRGVTPTPGLFGLDEEEARQMLVGQGLRLEASEEEGRYHDEVPKGHIVLQQPRAGTLLKRGREVTVVFSRGPQRTDVPSVVGRTLQAAQVELAAANLTVGRTLHIFTAAGKGGTVVAQDPRGGEKVEPEAEIDLFLALEDVSKISIMPDLVNENYEDVRRFFETRGFRIGRVLYEEYPGSPSGIVLRHYPLAGHPLRQGDVISLSVTPLPETEFDYAPSEDTATDENTDTASTGSDSTGH